MNEDITAIAAAEAVSVLNNTETSLIVKIPYEIIRILEEKASEYTGEVKLDLSLGLSEQPISEEAQAILSVIYKDYWCDANKKAEMNKIFEEANAEYDKEEAERLNPFKPIKKEENNININSNESMQIDNNSNFSENINEDNNETQALIEVPKKWYVRIFDRIVRFFRKK